MHVVWIFDSNKSTDSNPSSITLKHSLCQGRDYYTLCIHPWLS